MINSTLEIVEYVTVFIVKFGGTQHSFESDRKLQKRHQYLEIFIVYHKMAILNQQKSTFVAVVCVVNTIFIYFFFL